MFAVVEQPGQPGLDRAIHSLNSTRPGVVVAPPSPGITRPLPLAAVLMEGLGMPIPDAGFHPHDLARLPVWLGAHRVTDVVVMHADLYDADVLVGVHATVAGVVDRVWLLVDPGMGGAVASALHPVKAKQYPFRLFAALWLGGAAASEDPGPALGLERLWRAEHERLLEASRLGFGTGPYVAGFWRAATWANGRSPSRERTAERLRALAEEFADPACMVRALRGADVALRAFGWEVRIDHRRLAGGPATFAPPRAAVIRLGDVRVERDPFRAAAVALAALDLRVEEIVQVRLGDVPDDGASVRLLRDTVEVPPSGRPPIAAQREVRLRQGGRESDFLFDRNPPVTVSGMTRMILATQQAIGDSFFAASLRDRAGQHERWLNARGVWLHYRQRAERGPVAPEGMDLEEFKQILRERLADAPAEPPPCGCPERHTLPAEPMPAFPPERRRPPMAPDHPWRRLARPRGPSL